MKGDSAERRKRRAALRAGAFVYQGAGKKQGKNAPKDVTQCIQQSQAAQWCLARNGFQQKQCQHEVDKLEACRKLHQGGQKGKAPGKPK